jgi:hypothetical protein
MFISWSIREVQATSPWPGVSTTEHDAIPEKVDYLIQWDSNFSGMTQLRSVFTFSEVQSA